MAIKVSGLDALTSIADGDLIPIVDISDTTQAGTGSTKKVAISNLLGYAFHSLTASTYTAGTNGENVILADATSNAITITLPAASSSSKKLFIIKKIDATSNIVTIDGNSSETIDGDLEQNFSVQYTSITLYCDGSNWHII